MSVALASTHAVESFRYAIVLFAIFSVVFWRTLLMIVVMVVAIAVLVLLTSGAVLILQNLHHVHG
jgi:hypothetical protein